MELTSGVYKPRDLRTTALHEVVRDNLETLYGAIEDGAIAVSRRWPFSVSAHAIDFWPSVPMAALDYYRSRPRDGPGEGWPGDPFSMVGIGGCVRVLLRTGR